ncbi:MAG: hypothetical protein ABIV51_02095 [Saprospiraceae bacterium]
MHATDIERFEVFYEEHKYMVFGIISEISTSQSQKEYLFTSTFVTAFELNLPDQEYPSPYISLIRLIAKSAGDNLEEAGGAVTMAYPAFEDSPFLKKLEMFEMENVSILDLRAFTRSQANKDLRDDFVLLRNKRISQA